MLKIGREMLHGAMYGWALSVCFTFCVGKMMRIVKFFFKSRT
jgi:hypothetical protein